MNWPLTHPAFNLKTSGIEQQHCDLGEVKSSRADRPWMDEWRETFGTFLNISAAHPTKGPKWLAKMITIQNSSLRLAAPFARRGRSHTSHVLHASLLMRALGDDMQRGSYSVNSPDRIRGGCEHFTGNSVSHNYESAVCCSDSCEQRVTRGGLIRLVTLSRPVTMPKNLVAHL